LAAEVAFIIHPNNDGLGATMLTKELAAPAFLVCLLLCVAAPGEPVMAHLTTHNDTCTVH
jgi:hypothetical protein